MICAGSSGAAGIIPKPSPPETGRRISGTVLGGTRYLRGAIAPID